MSKANSQSGPSARKQKLRAARSASTTRGTRFPSVRTLNFTYRYLCCIQTCWKPRSARKSKSVEYVRGWPPAYTYARARAYIYGKTLRGSPSRQSSCSSQVNGWGKSIRKRRRCEKLVSARPRNAYLGRAHGSVIFRWPEPTAEARLAKRGEPQQRGSPRGQEAPRADSHTRAWRIPHPQLGEPFRLISPARIASASMCEPRDRWTDFLARRVGWFH